MEKTVFEVPGMDCAAEEHLVRMKLDGIASVRRLDLDAPERCVTVYHEGDLQAVERALGGLGLGARHVATEAADRDGALEERPHGAGQRKLLWAVFLINFGFFGLEVVAGVLSGSMGLVADSLDMLADAFVYGLALIAVGGTLARKRSIAKGSGYLQLALAVLGFIEVVRRVLGVEALPDVRIMILVSTLALCANGLSLYLLQRSRSREVHMRASMIFTSNDIVINLGVIAAGVLVSLTGSSLPDLVIGAIVFVIVSRGAYRILSLAD